jgi:hypothetical protein
MSRTTEKILTLAQGVITDCAAAAELVSRCAPRFVPRAEQTLENLNTSYASFTPAGADRQAVSALLALAVLPGEPEWIVLRRYEPGDYALPHRMGTELDDAADEARWVLVCPLAGNTEDGITTWDGERFVRVMDRPGQAVVAGTDTWCWTSPVRGRTRYTVAVGGR